MDKEIIKPQIRFKGFTNSWEKSYIKDLLEFERSDNYMISNLVKEAGQNPVLTANKAFILGYSNENNLYSKGDCILFDDFTLDTKYVNFPFLLNSSAIKILTSKNKMNLKFIFYLLNNANFIINGHSRHYISYIQPFQVAVPSDISEILNIQYFFDSIELLLTFYKRKLEKLENVKKSLLEKMFADENNPFPEIRFKEFTNSWEKKRLHDIYKFAATGGTPLTSNKEYYSGNIPFLTISDISACNKYVYRTEKSISKLGISNSRAWIVPKGSLSLSIYASIGKIGILEMEAATSQAFYNMIFDSAILSEHIYYQLHKMELFNEWTPYISTGTQGNLNAEKVQNLQIIISSREDEIININKLFSSIDNMLTFYKRKLEKLENIKKSLLEKMFC
ncbi:restriction endonuclease subunit S [Mycoplasma seminis]|uniref:Restriction endonuclease subunit S n=1 Tax=Mycoplasma seminis TaxID=512749 RepID=A0ABY9HDE4_9MOLU|nr:restriction endonuclease subunit S [Mycoplasma seminis]WLP85698.1 restriction endonuclease subunit S [Mycoplasma seminis]